MWTPNCTFSLLVSKANGTEGSHSINSTFCSLGSRAGRRRTTTRGPKRDSCRVQEVVLLIPEMMRKKNLSIKILMAQKGQRGLSAKSHTVPVHS